MKICSLYGAGFYYIPGTDTCMKLGGFVRTEWDFYANGSFAPVTADPFNRTTNDVRNRTRFLISTDVRSQTAYGTLRAYGRAGWQWTTGDFQVGGSQGGSTTTATASITGAAIGSSSTTYLDRAFIQLGGWTFGKTQSFFDFFSTPTYSLQTNFLWVDTGGSGTPVLAYTASFGNGFSATLSLEDGTEAALPIVAVQTGLSLVPGGTSIASNAGNVVPDIVGNLRVDQGWGSAQVMGVAHLLRATYYAGANQFGHPGDTWGFAGGAGLTLNLPMLAKGDTFSVMGTYCSGAARYCSNPGGGIRGSGAFYGNRQGNNTISAGWLEDAYYNNVAATGGGLELSKAYSLVAGINHYWMPNLQTSLYGGYLNFKANSSTVDTLSCATTANVVSGGVLGAGCRDFSAWQIGSRTVWQPVANLDLGVDVMYHKVRTAYANAGVASAAAGVPAIATVGDVGHWAGIFRVQRNFWP